MSMKKETYLKYRVNFLNQYYSHQKNELGFVHLEKFKIRDFKKFIFLFSFDFVDCRFNNTTKSLGIKQFFIKHNKTVTSIKINSEKSMFDKYDNFESVQKFYKINNQ